MQNADAGIAVLADEAALTNAVYKTTKVLAAKMIFPRAACLVTFEGEDVIDFLIEDFRTILRWQSMASKVTGTPR